MTGDDWIRFRERTPETSEPNFKCECWVTDGIDVYVASYCSIRREFFDCDIDNGDIVAWQPYHELSPISRTRSDEIWLLSNPAAQGQLAIRVRFLMDSHNMTLEQATNKAVNERCEGLGFKRPDKSEADDK